jgi:hypothetical protein
MMDNVAILIHWLYLCAINYHIKLMLNTKSPKAFQARHHDAIYMTSCHAYLAINASLLIGKANIPLLMFVSCE